MPRKATKKQQEESESSDQYDPKEDSEVEDESYGSGDDDHKVDSEDEDEYDYDDSRKKSKQRKSLEGRRKGSSVKSPKQKVIAEKIPSTRTDNTTGCNTGIDSDNGKNVEDGNTKVTPLTQRKNKRKRKTFQLIEKEEALPTSARKTERGGYVHKSSTKAKISMANAGNTPWNLGKNRSSADRAKIAAGVRARNRAILLEKLQRLGMTEEEYVKKKKEVKYIRERIRRAKVANQKHQQTELQATLDAALKEMNEQAQQEEREKMETEAKEAEKKKAEAILAERAKNLFRRDIHLTPFSFSVIPENDSYDRVCPNGGPGGLICCESCSRLYQTYLTRTVQDIEVQRLEKGAAEVKEILGFVADDTQALAAAIDATRNTIPPLPPLPGPKKQYRTSSSSRKGGDSAGDIEVGEFNLTSTIDVGSTTYSGAFYSV